MLTPVLKSRLYASATGLKRKVVKVDASRVWFREGSSIQLRSTTLKQFAKWAHADVTPDTGVRMAGTERGSG